MFTDWKYLQHHKDDGEEAYDGVEDIHAVRVKVNNEVGCELKNMICNRPNPKDKSPLS